MNELNNNKKATMVVHDLRSSKEKEEFIAFCLNPNVKDTPYTEDKNNKHRLLYNYLRKIKRDFDVVMVENFAEVTGKKQGAAQFSSKHLVICTSVCSIAKNDDLKGYVPNLLFKAEANGKKYATCQLLCKKGLCKRTCELAWRPYCPHKDENGYDLWLRNGEAEVRVYGFHDKKEFVLCDSVHKANIFTVDFWYSIVNDAKQRAKESFKFAKDSERLEDLLWVSTPWLGYANLYDMFQSYANHWELFMSIISDTVDLIQSEGVWDVEVCPSFKRYRENNTSYYTIKSENGSIALSPLRQVYVKNPKVKMFDATFDYDVLLLFLTLTFYKHAGEKPMLPVVQVCDKDGNVDYKLDYSKDRYFGDESCNFRDEDLDTSTLTYISNYGYEEDEDEDTEDSEDADELVENDEEVSFAEAIRSDIDADTDWNVLDDEDDYKYSISEFVGGDTNVSLLVTDDREAQPFSFKINYFGELPTDVEVNKRVYACELNRKQQERLNELEAEGKLNKQSDVVAVTNNRVAVEERLSWALSDYRYFWMQMNKAKYKFEFDEYLKGFYRAMNILKKINMKHAGTVDIQAVSTEYGISRDALQELINRF